MSELPDNATPADAAAYARRRLDQGASRDQLITVARRLGAYDERNTSAAQAILDELNRRRP